MSLIAGLVGAVNVAPPGPLPTSLPHSGMPTEPANYSKRSVHMNSLPYRRGHLINDHSWFLTVYPNGTVASDRNSNPIYGTFTYNSNKNWIRLVILRFDMGFCFNKHSYNMFTITANGISRRPKRKCENDLNRKCVCTFF